MYKMHCTGHFVHPPPGTCISPPWLQKFQYLWKCY